MFGINLGNLVVHITGNSSGLDTTLNEVEQKLNSFGKKSFLKITLPVATSYGVILNEYRKFNQSMIDATSIMGKISPQVSKALESTARDLAKNSTKSASELARAYFYMASAGYSAEESMSNLNLMNKFAIAGQFDLQRATTLLADSQKALGLYVNDTVQQEKNLIRVSDVLTKANILANGTVEDFAEALATKSAAALRIVNKDVEEGVAVLAAFADQGMKGQKAGEALAIVSRDLQKAAIRSSDEWRRLGISVYDTNNNMRNYADIIQDLERVMKPVSDEQRKIISMNLGFQERSFFAIQQLIGTSDRIKRYEKALREAGGVTDQVARVQMTSFNNQLKVMMNRLKDVAITIGEWMAPVIYGLNNLIGTAIERWNALSESTRKIIISLVSILAVMGPLAISFGFLIKVMSISFGGFSTVMRIVVGGLKLFQMGITSTITSFMSLSNPFYLLIAVATGLLMVLVGKNGLANSWETVQKYAVSFFTTVGGWLSNFTGSLGSLYELVSKGLAWGWMVLKDVVVYFFKTTIYLSSIVGEYLFKFLEWFLGEKGMKSAWETTGEVVKKFFLNTIGFLSNFSKNMDAVTSWIRKNWKNLIYDIVQMIGVSLSNMIYNIAIMLKITANLVSALFGWISLVFEKYLIDWLAKAGQWIWKWIKQIGSWLKDAFSGKELNPGTIMKEMEDSFTKGASNINFFETAKDIILKGISEMKGPLNGFKSTLKDLPKLDLSIHGPDAKQVKQVKDTVGKIIKDVQKSILPFRDLEDDTNYRWKGKDSNKKVQDFKEISLNRFSLEGLTGFGLPKEQAVAAKGVESRLDKIINIIKKPVSEASKPAVPDPWGPIKIKPLPGVKETFSLQNMFPNVPKSAFPNTAFNAPYIPPFTAAPTPKPELNYGNVFSGKVNWGDITKGNVKIPSMKDASKPIGWNDMLSFQNMFPNVPKSAIAGEFAFPGAMTPPKEATSKNFSFDFSKGATGKGDKKVEAPGVESRLDKIASAIAAKMGVPLLKE